jgi:signal transduction histidine kinase
VSTVERPSVAAPAPAARRGGLTARMLLASGLLMLVLAATFAVLLAAMADLRAAARAARSSEEVLATANELERLVIDLETGVRGFVLTREEQFLEPWHAAHSSLPARAAALERLSAGNAEQAHTARQITQAASAYVEQYATPLLEAARRADPAARSLAATADGKRRVDAMRVEFDAFTAAERRLVQAQQGRSDEAARRAVVAAVGGLAVSLLLVLIFAGYLTRAIVRPVLRSARMAVRLAGGNLSTRMPATGVAEIGQLERAFNEMAGSLERNRDDLAAFATEQAALRRVATLVAQSVSPSVVFEAVTREVGLLCDADLARMERYEEDWAVTGVAAWSRVPVELAVGTRFILDGLSIARGVRQRGEPVRVDSFGEDTGAIAREAQAVGIRSSVGCPIVVAGRLWGVIAASTKREEPFPAGTEAQITGFTELVATAIANAESRAELAASRARVVAAADETRRRLERDLHDGAQQRLVSLALRLRATATTIPPDMREAHHELAGVGSELDETLGDLRELSRGIHPAILSEGGLGPALRTLARRSSVPVQLQVGMEARLPARVEVTAYYVVSEALTNVAKHANASAVEVDVDTDDRLVRLAIRDDGVGGADPARGSGLIGLKDRVEGTGGTLRVESRPGEGTSLLVELPIDAGQSPDAS